MINKKAIVGKVILGGILAIVLFLVYVGISINQGYNSVKTIEREQKNIEEGIRDILEINECEKTSKLEESKEIIFSEIDSSCKNPLISYVVGKVTILPFKCEDKEKFKEDLETKIRQFEDLCIRANKNSEKDFEEEYLEIDE